MSRGFHTQDWSTLALSYSPYEWRLAKPQAMEGVGDWIPACAGMTGDGGGGQVLK
ncbi:MAG: hypothetical protein SH868_02235 [Bythopirellula sp.]|nr:hypothetical protein [Bythopirellula sp.]